MSRWFNSAIPAYSTTCPVFIFFKLTIYAPRLHPRLHSGYSGYMHCVDVCVDVWVYDGVWKLGCGVYWCIRKLHSLWVFMWVIRVIIWVCGSLGVGMYVFVRVCVYPGLPPLMLLPSSAEAGPVPLTHDVLRGCRVLAISHRFANAQFFGGPAGCRYPIEQYQKVSYKGVKYPLVNWKRLPEHLWIYATAGTYNSKKYPVLQTIDDSLQKVGAMPASLIKRAVLGLVRVSSITTEEATTLAPGIHIIDNPTQILHFDRVWPLPPNQHQAIDCKRLPRFDRWVKGIDVHTMNAITTAILAHHNLTDPALTPAPPTALHVCAYACRLHCIMFRHSRRVTAPPPGVAPRGFGLSPVKCGSRAEGYVSPLSDASPPRSPHVSASPVKCGRRAEGYVSPPSDASPPRSPRVCASPQEDMKHDHDPDEVDYSGDVDRQSDSDMPPLVDTSESDESDGCSYTPRPGVRRARYQHRRSVSGWRAANATSYLPGHLRPDQKEEGSDPDCDFGADDSDVDSDYAGDEDMSDGEQVYPKRRKGVSVSGYARQYPRGSRPATCDNHTVEAMSDQHWQAQKATHGYVRLTEVATGSEFIVPASRVPKAKLHLRYDACAEVMKMKACTCRRRCFRLLQDPDKIREFRKPVFSQCSREKELNAFIHTQLQATQGSCTIKGMDGTVHTVCNTYYSRVHSISRKRLQTIKKAVAAGSMPDNRRRKSILSKASPKYDIALAFWDLFFEENCQRPNDDIRLFPVEKSYTDIYKEYFKPWFQRLVERGQYEETQKPGFDQWKRGRAHKKFADVQNRAKHTHARCTTCAELKALLLEGFKTGDRSLQYEQRRRLHDEEVTQWRQLEKTLKSEAVSNPHRTLLFTHDGTSALGLPRTTHRALKNMDPYRFEVVPWMIIEHTGNRKDYVYSPSNAIPKDANTLISQIHAAVRRGKSDYTHARHKARRLVFIADSASENKNNTLFAYCADLVENKWFDEIELLFGPVGHTHNGVDATHKIHNQNVASNFSGDLGHFVYNYSGGFNINRPDASILQRTLDWTKYYKDSLRPISGFTNTTKDPETVRGFRIARDAEGKVGLTWKRDPAIEKDWRGSGGFKDTNGFYVFKSLPVGVPEVSSRKEITEDMAAKSKTLTCESMIKMLRGQGLEASAKFNYECDTSGHIPVHRRLEDDALPAGEWGPLAEIGAVEGKRARMRLLNDWFDPREPNTRNIFCAGAASFFCPFHMWTCFSKHLRWQQTHQLIRY